MKLITVEDLEALAIGSAILGAGGGGDPSTEKYIAKRQLELHGPVKMISVDELKAEDVVVPVAYMGAPLIAIERLPSGTEFLNVLSDIEKYLGKRPTVLMAAEIGGANAFTSLSVGALLNLPVLDADSMGRAFPELQMTSFNVHGHSSSPAFLSDSKGNSVVVNGRNNREVEHIARHITVALGSSAALALHVMNGVEAAKYSIPRSVSYAIEIGSQILKSQKENTDPLQALLKFTEGTLLGTGVISDIDQRISDGFLRGTVNIVNVEENYKMLINYQNENIAALKDGNILATSPDLISIVDAQTGKAITTESLSYGLRVCVLALPCDPIWKTEKGLKLVGPRYFGYPFDYIPFRKEK